MVSDNTALLKQQLDNYKDLKIRLYVVNEHEMRVIITHGKDTHLCVNNGDNYRFYKNGELHIEYTVDELKRIYNLNSWMDD